MAALLTFAREVVALRQVLSGELVALRQIIGSNIVFADGPISHRKVVGGQNEEMYGKWGNDLLFGLLLMYPESEGTDHLRKDAFGLGESLAEVGVDPAEEGVEELEFAEELVAFG